MEIKLANNVKVSVKGHRPERLKAGVHTVPDPVGLQLVKHGLAEEVKAPAKPAKAANKAKEKAAK